MDNKEKFISKAQKVHGILYRYDEINYINSKTKIGIICTTHGVFWQTPANHLSGYGCPKCGTDSMVKKRRWTLDRFRKEGSTVHNGKYKYIEYVNARTKIPIICPQHDIFYQTPHDHLNGHGCPKCRSSKLEIEIYNFLKGNKIEFKYQASKKDLPWLYRQCLDFYLPTYNVAIECQGEQHFNENGLYGCNGKYDIIKQRDELKLQKCRENGIKLVYYSNLGIKYPYDVFEDKDKLLAYIQKGEDY